MAHPWATRYLRSAHLAALKAGSGTARVVARPFVCSSLIAAWYSLQGDLPEHRHASVREVAVHISNHSMQVGDRGVIVVGASAELGDLGHLGSAGTSKTSVRTPKGCHGASNALTQYWAAVCSAGRQRISMAVPNSCHESGSCTPTGTISCQAANGVQ